MVLALVLTICCNLSALCSVLHKIKCNFTTVKRMHFQAHSFVRIYSPHLLVIGYCIREIKFSDIFYKYIWCSKACYQHLLNATICFAQVTTDSMKPIHLQGHRAPLLLSFSPLGQGRQRSSILEQT